MNDLMTAAGIADSREAALAYLRYAGGGQNRPDDMAAYVDNAARVLAYLHQHGDIPFRRLDLAEFYYPVSPGSMPHGRLLICQPFRLRPWVSGVTRCGCHPFITAYRRR